MINVDSLDFTKKTTGELDVSVTENRGRYTGCVAVNEFRYSIIREVSNEEVRNAIFN